VTRRAAANGVQDLTPTREDRAPASRASTVDQGQAPRVTLESPHREGEIVQAPRGQDTQSPRGEDRGAPRGGAEK